MGPSEARATKAINAMKVMDISEKRVKPILRNLLRLYDKNWEIIEDENYRVLIDAIFEQENVGEDENKSNEVQVLNESSPPPLKRLRTRAQADQVPVSGEVPLIRPKVEGADPPAARRPRSAAHESSVSAVHDKQAPSSSNSLSDCEEIYHLNVRDRTVPARSSIGSRLKEPKIEPGIVFQPKENSRDARESSSLIKPKYEPMEDDPPFEMPIATIPPPGSQQLAISEDPLHEDVSSIANGFPVQMSGSTGHLNGVEILVSKAKQNDISGAARKSVINSELANDGEIQKSFEIASSPSGEVKISLNCNQPELSDSRVPSLEAVLKAVEDKCLRSYRILEPNFSMVNLMQEMCKSFLELSNKSPDPKKDTIIHLAEDFSFLKNSNLQNAFGPRGQQGKYRMPGSSSDGSVDIQPSSETPMVLLLADGKTAAEKDTENCDPNSSSSQSLVVVPECVAVDCVTPVHDVNDISKGEEKVRISVINELSSEAFPPKFYYIPRNIVYQNAYMNFSLARIGDEDCCSSCFGDCLSSSITCACARETGGEFAYTLEGLVKEKLVDECISLNRDPQQERHYYCKECPLERSKDGLSDACKGHLVRKFIKECWSKCGCNMQCGNRVVQRGIRCNLQVFFTSEGKGWGLRTLEDLPKGTFVCEYVGEVLTNTELHERNMRSTGNERHTYPVLLDADWGSENVLKDEEALCLDATHYGNVARFINHRCFDGNMVEIPVEVETPDHHYYHLAFFTTRNVDALEELTWDYGIDFSDHNHPVKGFRCICGSKCCRDMKRSHRSKSRR